MHRASIGPHEYLALGQTCETVRAAGPYPSGWAILLAREAIPARAGMSRARVANEDRIVGVPADAPTLRLRHSLGGGFEGALRLLPPPMRAPLARRLLRSAPPRLRLSLAGRAIPALRPHDNLPIVAGPLEGWRWIAASGPHACVEGTHETENQALLLEHVRPGHVVFDVGANVGFFTLLASQLVGPTGAVVAFEPFPAALKYLRRHLELNRVENTTVVDAAVSDAPGRVHFRAHGPSDGGELSAEVVRLDQLCATGKVPLPDLIKIDVEGEELKVLRGAARILRERRPTILLATHGAATHRACCRFLVQRGYRLEELPYEMTAIEFDFLGELAAIPA